MAASLRDELIGIGVPGLLAAQAPSGLRAAELQARVRDLPEPMASVLQLFALGAAVPIAAVEPSLTTDEAQRLIDHRYLDLKDGIARLRDVRLVEHFGALVFVGTDSSAGYYGRDSVGLGRHVQGAQGHVLDLFASTGCQSFVAAASAEVVTAVEIDDSLSALFEVNQSLAASKTPVDVRWGDARTIGYAETAFDVIAANAPLLPNFGVAALSPGADGGDDGAAVLLAALRRVSLRENGRLVSTCTLLGNSRHGPDIGRLEALATEKGWALTVLPTGYSELRIDNALVTALAGMLTRSSGRSEESVLAELTAVWQRKDVDRAYFCLLFGSCRAEHLGEVKLARLSGGAGWWL